MTKQEDESDRRNPEWMWVTVAGTRNPFPGRKQHEPVYGSQYNGELQNWHRIITQTAQKHKQQIKIINKN